MGGGLSGRCVALEVKKDTEQALPDPGTCRGRASISCRVLSPGRLVARSRRDSGSCR